MDQYPEEILDKVYDALYKAGLDRFSVDKAVNRMIEAGIIFSEKTDIEKGEVWHEFGDAHT